MAELEKLNSTARQALIMAADAEKAGNADKAAQYTSAAESIANQLIQVEKDVESLKTLVLDSTQAADQAKAAVQQNSRLLQEKIAEKSKLLSQLEQAKMQEEMNKAMSQLSETVGDDVPTLNEVQREDRGPLREGLGGLRAQRGLGRVAGARGRAGDRQRRGPEPPLRAARRARPRRAERRHATGRRRRPAGLIRPTRCRPAVTSGRQQHEVVAVDHLVHHAVGQVAGVLARRPPEVGRVDEHHAAREHRAIAAAHVDDVALPEATDRHR